MITFTDYLSFNDFIYLHEWYININVQCFKRRINSLLFNVLQYKTF